MKQLSEGNVFKKHSKFLNRHIGYFQFLKCSHFLSALQSFDIRIFQTLEEFPLEAERIEKGYSLAEHATGLPKLNGLSNDDPLSMFTSSPNRYDPHQASHIAIQGSISIFAHALNPASLTCKFHLFYQQAFCFLVGGYCWLGACIRPYRNCHQGAVDMYAQQKGRPGSCTEVYSTSPRYQFCVA